MSNETQLEHLKRRFNSIYTDDQKIIVATAVVKYGWSVLEALLKVEEIISDEWLDGLDDTYSHEEISY